MTARCGRPARWVPSRCDEHRTSDRRIDPPTCDAPAPGGEAARDEEARARGYQQTRAPAPGGDRTKDMSAAHNATCGVTHPAEPHAPCTKERGHAGGHHASLGAWGAFVSWPQKREEPAPAGGAPMMHLHGHPPDPACIGCRDECGKPAVWWSHAVSHGACAEHGPPGNSWFKLAERDREGKTCSAVVPVPAAEPEPPAAGEPGGVTSIRQSLALMPTWESMRVRTWELRDAMDHIDAQARALEDAEAQFRMEYDELRADHERVKEWATNADEALAACRAEAGGRIATLEEKLAKRANDYAHARVDAASARNALARLRARAGDKSALAGVLTAMFTRWLNRGNELDGSDGEELAEGAADALVAYLADGEDK